ncbi:MAG: hypothetical protein LBO77_05775 [Desulfovibrio sp.]|jgi:hypothetical protein|nr:hypothetical protein [Desulfovibrio sp.]
MAKIPAITAANVRTLMDWGQFFKKDGRPVDIIELMNQEDTILDDILWREATDYDGHRTTIRAGLPQIYWKRLYRGTPVSKSQVTAIKDPVGMLEGRSVLDVKLLEIHQSQAKAYREGEARAFTEAMRQELATAIFYGDIKGNPDGIHGLDPRYAFKNAPQVVDAGAASGNCTSMFGVVWGENEVTGIFPKDSVAGLKHKAIPEYDAYDDAGDAFRAVGDLFSWHVGLSVRDWRCVVRVCNIPVANLELAKGDAGFVDLHRLTIKAKNMIPPEKRARLKWYVNQEVMTALELQSSDAGNVHLQYGDLFKSKPIPYLHGAPVRQNDAILTTETPLAAAS